MDKLKNLWSIAQSLCDGLNFLPSCDDQQLRHSIGEYLLEQALDYIHTYHDDHPEKGLEELEKEIDRRLLKIYTEGVPSSVNVFESDLIDDLADVLKVEKD